MCESVLVSKSRHKPAPNTTLLLGSLTPFSFGVFGAGFFYFHNFNLQFMQFIKQNGLLTLRDLLEVTKDCEADDIVYLFEATPIVKARFSNTDKRIYLQAEYHNEKDALEIAYFRGLDEAYLDIELSTLDDIAIEAFDCITIGHGAIILS